MASIDKNQISKIYSVINAKERLKCLLIFKKDTSLTHKEVFTLLGISSSSHTTYFLRKLVEAKLLKHEKSRYFLTRIGLDTLKLIKNFEKVCMTYDLSDCDADGKIGFIVKRNL